MQKSYIKMQYYMCVVSFHASMPATCYIWQFYRHQRSMGPPAFSELLCQPRTASAHKKAGTLG